MRQSVMYIELRAVLVHFEEVRIATNLSLQTTALVSWTIHQLQGEVFIPRSTTSLFLRKFHEI